MRTVFLALCVLAVALAVNGAPASLTYKEGDIFSYSFSSQVQTGTQSSLGALSTMSGTVEVECQSINKAGNYMFAMNMFDVVVSASNPTTTLAPASRALGYDMYFEQTPAGQIVNVWYQDGDAPYYVEVKLGAINSFHTSVIAPGTTSTVHENDVVGQHSSLYAAQVQSDSSLALAKGFDQGDVSIFVDPHLKPSNVVLKAQATANVHPNGYIQATSVTQTVTLTTMDAPTGVNPDGWNSLLTAQGSLGLKINPSATQKRLSAPVTAERLASSAFVAGTLSSFGALANNYARSLSPAQTEITLDELRTLVATDRLQATKLRRVASYFRAHPEMVQATFEPLLVDELLESRSVQRLFAVLASANVPSTHDLLIRHGVRSPSVKKQLAAINTISTSQVGSPAVRDALWSLVKADSSLTSTVSRAAALAYGSVLSRSSMSVRKVGVKQLMTLKSVAAARDDDAATRVIASAMYNTLPRPAASQDVPEPTPGSMPFNKSWSKTAEYGSVNTIGAQFAAEYFVGTNFDCSQDTFNYLALVSSNASANLFMYVQDVFNVRAVYGREGAQLIGNELYLQVFYKVIVDMQIPNEDCKSESYDVGSFTAPGIDVSYTLWVSCIPVVFEAGVDFEADLSYGWSICQNNLYAQVSATPNAKLTASASAQTDLLIVEGEVSFQADFDVSITPQAFIDGYKCSVGVDVTLTADPMQASVDAEYRHKKCEWWIFDCKWSDWTTDILWSWSAPKDNEILFQQTWPIHL